MPFLLFPYRTLENQINCQLSFLFLLARQPHTFAFISSKFYLPRERSLTIHFMQHGFNKHANNECKVLEVINVRKKNAKKSINLYKYYEKKEIK